MKKTENIGKVLSKSLSAKEFFERLKNIKGIDENIINKAKAIYDSPLGKQIQTKYEKDIKPIIENILKKFTDSPKITKIATEIAEKSAKCLTGAVIIQQVIEGEEKGGPIDAILRGVVACAETVILPMVLNTILDAWPIIPAAIAATLAGIIVEKLINHFLNHIKL